MTWPLARLEDVAQIVGGATPKTTDSKYWDGDVLWATPADLSSLNCRYIANTLRKITTAGLGSCAAQILPANSVLLSSRAPIGHVAINLVPMATNQGFKSIVPDASKLHPGFMYWWLRKNKDLLQRFGNGATFKEISKAVVSNIQVPLPSLDEQRKVAAILDQADDLRRKRRLALKKLNTLREAHYQDLALEDGAATWPRLPISELAKIIRTGPFGSQLLHSEFIEDGIAVLGIDNTQNNEFSWSQRRYISESKYQELTRYTVFPGDVLITIMGTCGRCAIVPETIPIAINTKHLCCIRLDSSKCLPDFLHAALIYDRDVLTQLGVRERGAVMPGLNMQLIRETSLRVPPITIQTRFAHASKRIHELEMLQRKHLAELDSLFASLQHHAFTWKLAPSIAAATLASLQQ